MSVRIVTTRRPGLTKRSETYTTDLRVWNVMTEKQREDYAEHKKRNQRIPEEVEKVDEFTPDSVVTSWTWWVIEL